MSVSKNISYLKKVFGLMSLVCLGLTSYSEEIENENKEITDVTIKKVLDDSLLDENYTGIKILGKSEVDARKLKSIVIEDTRELDELSTVTGIDLTELGNEAPAKLLGKDLKIKINSEEDSGFLQTHGLVLYEGGEVKLDNLEIDLQHSLRQNIDDDEVSTGLSLYNISVPAKNPTIFSADNVNIKMRNTENSENDALYGIVIDNSENLDTKISFKVNKDLNIEIKDNSESQKAGMIGISLISIDGEAEINNSNITLEGGGNTGDDYSAAIEIGVTDSTDVKSSGILVSKGKMKIDTTKAPNAYGIEVLGTGGEIRANEEGSSADIKTQGTAIIFKGYKTLIEQDSDEDDIKGFKTIAGRNQKISLKDAVVQNKNSDATLIVIDEEVKNTTLNISGINSRIGDDKTNLMHVKDGSDITFNLTDKAVAEGPITNHYTGVTRLNVTDGATWKLSNRYISSNVTKLVLKNGGILDARFLEDTVGIKSYIDETKDVAFVSDGGIIRMDNNKYEDNLILYKNYEGKNGAELRVNTLWNNDSSTSKSDKLSIYGEAKGMTKVTAVGIDGKENIIDGDIKQIQKKIQNSPVVVEAGKAGEGTFTGKAKTRGATEVQLASKISTDGKREFFWTTNTLQDDQIIEPTIYNQVVPAYTSIGKINKDLGFTTLATLNERKGDARLEKNNKEQAWFRVFGENADYKGKHRFEADTDLYGAQAGYEFNINLDANGNKNIYGVYIAHIEANTKFYDRYRTVNGRISSDKYTGKAKTRDLSLGLTKTKYYTNGMYLDLVGQFSFIENKYQARDEENKKQKGNAIILSTELGKKYDISKNLYLEPQVQLAYQYLKLKDFNDGIRNVNYDNEGDFRGRLGIRLATKVNERKITFYSLANVIHDFNDKTKVHIGKDKVEEKYANTQGEIGLGLEYLFNESTSIYGDFRYERSFEKKPKYDSYRGTIGLKYCW